MKIALITSWGTKCGVAEYSSYLLDAYKSLDIDVDLIPIEARTEEVMDIERVSFKNQLSLHDYDIIHVQYQNFLYDDEWLNFLLKTSSPKKVLTFHDKCVPDLDWVNIDGVIMHKDNFLEVPVKKKVVPPGIPLIPVTLLSFGMGRNKEEEIKECCEELGFKYVALDGNPWISRDSLIDYIKLSDGVVLWYPENKGAGTSLTARISIGARRPLFINNTTWFSDIYGNNVYKFSGKEELKNKLKIVFSDENIDRFNWKEVAKKQLEFFKEL